jgi:hypothetical protein
MQSTCYFGLILIKLDFFRQIFENYSHIKFNENHSSGNHFVPCGRTDGRTDRHDEVNIRLAIFCEGA